MVIFSVCVFIFTFFKGCAYIGAWCINTGGWFILRSDLFCSHVILQFHPKLLSFTIFHLLLTLRHFEAYPTGGRHNCYCRQEVPRSITSRRDGVVCIWVLVIAACCFQEMFEEKFLFHVWDMVSAATIYSHNLSDTFSAHLTALSWAGMLSKSLIGVWMVVSRFRTQLTLHYVGMG